MHTQTSAPSIYTSLLSPPPPPLSHSTIALHLAAMPALLPPPLSLSSSLSILVAVTSLLAMFSSAAMAPGAPSCAALPDHDSRNIPILHAFSPCSPILPSKPHDSWEDMIMDLLAGDASRLNYLSSLATAGRSFVPVGPGRQLLQIPNYILRVKLGSPPQQLLAAFDTSNDAAWFPCAACVGCPSASPSFAESRSTSFRPLPCGAPPCGHVPNPSCPTRAACAFNMTYGGSSIQASLAQDSLALASDAVQVYTFGCLNKVTGTSVPPQGLIGFGRGPLSFLSQSKTLYSSTFSYCLPSFKSLNFSGTLRLGPVGQPKRIKTTPLLLNPHRPSLYYVDMTGIRVGRRVVAVPPSALAFDRATGAGTIVDSGTMFTRLVAPAYVAVRDAFRLRVKGAGAGAVTSLGAFDTCYVGPITAPTITFMFKGMNVALPPENTLIHSTAGSTACLAMAAAPDNGMNSGPNVIANMQQQNHRVLFDVPNGKVGFAREHCSTAA